MTILGEQLVERDFLLQEVKAGRLTMRGAAKKLSITVIALSDWATKHGYCDEECPVCGEKFITHTAVSLHIARMHPAHCTECGVMVPSRISKQKRMCQVCFDKFNADRTLKYPPKKYYPIRKQRRDAIKITKLLATKEALDGQKENDIDL